MTNNPSAKKHVFTDWDLVQPGYGLKGDGDKTRSWEMPHGIELRIHPPRLDWEPILEPDRPWELDMNWHTSLFEDEGRFRLYYRIYDISGRLLKGADNYLLAYAESEDGVTWTKPNIGTYDFNGSTDNNVIDLGRPAGSPMVFKDPSADDDERYKLVFRGQVDGIAEVWGATSADGLRWNVIDEPLLTGYASDTHNVFAYDEEKAKYVGYWRGRRPVDGASPQTRRTIAYAETEDFRRWPGPRTIVGPDAQDGPHADIYTNSYSAWPGARGYLMFPSIYERERDVLELHLFTSRDGLGWERISRDPVIPQGEPGTWGENGVWAGAGLVSFKPGEWSLPFTSLAVTHNHQPLASAAESRLHRGHISLATWREDGFTSIEAKSDGRFTTTPLTLDGNRLVLNSWSSHGGEIRAELVEEGTKEMYIEPEAVPGYGFEDCDPITGDNISRVVTWNGRSDLSAWSGKEIRLRFKMHRSRLHAIQFA